MPFIYTDSDYQLYTEQLAFVELQLTVPVDLSSASSMMKSMAARIAQIRAIKPGAPKIGPSGASASSSSTG